MRAQDLTAERLEKLRQSSRPKLHYIRKLKNRMIAKQFPDYDRMLRDVQIIEAGLKDLVAEIETYLSYRRQSASAEDRDRRKIF